MKYTLILGIMAFSACGTAANNSGEFMQSDAAANTNDAGASSDAGQDTAGAPNQNPGADAGASADKADGAANADVQATQDTLSADAGTVGEDAAAPQADASAPQPDVAAPQPDVAAPQPDATPAPDATPPSPDVAPTPAPGCTSNDACTPGVCDLTSGACVQCQHDVDCAAGQACQANACVAVAPPKPDPTPVPTPTPAPKPTPSADNLSLAADAWTTAYDGYGSVTYDALNGIYLTPMVSLQPSETHAALVLTKLASMKDFHLVVTATTEQQLRQGSAPNTWETFWIFFNYQPTSAGKDTNYFALKTNGVELGTATAEIGQTFLQTDNANATAVGVANTYDIVKVGNHVIVKINGELAMDYTGPIYDMAGAIGLYTEDARVHITAVSLTVLA